MQFNTPSGNPDGNEIYTQFPFLADYDSYINKDGTFSSKDILGEGNYGLILNGLPERVYKIGKNKENSDQLKNEYGKHLKFYLEYNAHLKQNFPNFRIPETPTEPIQLTGEMSGEELFVYEIEKINGHNLLSYLIKEELENIGKSIQISDYTDMELEELYKNYIGKNIDVLRNGNSGNVTNAEEKFMKSVAKGQIKGVGDPFPSLLFKKFFPNLYDQISNAISDLKKKGYKHLDLHAKNIMISYQGDKPIVYLIDFGISEVPKKIPEINF